MINAAIHAMIHCHNARPTAHLVPNSRLTDAIAATHGEYSKLNTNKELAANGVISAVIFPLNKTPNVETTLSFAINPLSKDVTILQSPNPNGDNKGAMNPATIAKML